MMQAESDKLWGVWMKKLAAVLAAFALAALGVFATSTAANAYPGTSPQIHVNHQTIVEGSTLVVHGDAVPGCDPWTFTFNGQTQTATGEHVTVRFKVPKVDRKTTYTLSYTCNQVVPSATMGQSVAVRDQVFHGSIKITVVPREAQGAGPANAGSALPNTGGPNLGLLTAGGALVLAGGAAIGIGLRRRHVSA